MSESIPQGWQGQQQPDGYPPPANSYGQQHAPAQQEEEQEQVPSEFDYLFRGSAAAEPTSVMPPRGVTMQPPPPQQADYQHGYGQDAYQQQAYQQQSYAAPANPYGAQGYGAQQPYGYGGQEYERNDTAANLVPGLGGPGGDYPGQYPDRQGWQPEPGGPDGGSRRTITVVAGIAVVAAIVGISVAVFGSGGGSSSNASSGKSTTGTAPATSSAGSNETAKQEADGVYALIQSATSLRRQVGTAVDDAQRCVNESQDAATLMSVSKQRQQLATDVAKLPVDKLSQGKQLTSLLAQAWNDSATDDADYAAWAQANVNCKGKATSNASYRQANGMTNQISNEKASAVTIWNQVAVPAGETSISSTDL